MIRQTYSHYETGRSKPSVQTLYKLAGLYNISVEDLLHLSVSLDREEYYDAPSPSESSLELDGFLNYYNDAFNKKKYQFFSDEEKELLYFFNLIPDRADRREIIDITKIKVKKYNR